MTDTTDRYTYAINGQDGTFDLVNIVSPQGEVIASLYYWDEPDTDEAARVEKSARIICGHLNHWWIGSEPKSVTDIEGVLGAGPEAKTDENAANGRLFEAAPKLLAQSVANVTVMLQAADLLRELGYDEMAIALHVQGDVTSDAIAEATGSAA